MDSSLHNQIPSTSQFPAPFFLQSPMPLNFTFNFNSPPMNGGLASRNQFPSLLFPAATSQQASPLSIRNESNGLSNVAVQGQAARNDILPSPTTATAALNKSLQTDIWMKSHFDAAYTPSQSGAPSIMSAMSGLSDASSIHSQMSALTGFNFVSSTRQSVSRINTSRSFQGLPQSAIPVSVSSSANLATQSPSQPVKSRHNVNESIDVFINSLGDKDPVTNHIIQLEISLLSGNYSGRAS